jgi:hypothetical protein
VKRNVIVMDQNTTGDNGLTALRLAEEKKCAGYLEARKAMVALAGRVASLRLLAAQHPRRADYRRARDAAVEEYHAAVDRTRLAWSVYQRAQMRADLVWTATEGRHPRVLALADGEVAA